MTDCARTTRTEAGNRAPWSTRLVILIAFAVQLAPVSERVGLAGLRLGEKLALLDGALAGLWLGDGRVGEEADARVGLASPARGAKATARIARGGAPVRHVAPLAQVGPTLLPTPPPAAA